MKIKALLLSHVVLAAMLLPGMAVQAANEGDAKRVLDLVELQSQQYGGVPVKPARGIRGSSGDYLSPYTKEGGNTEWLDEVLEVKEEKGGFECKKRETSVQLSGIPSFGGSNPAKCERKTVIRAAGGWDDIKDDSEVSFHSVNDLAVYMHALHYDDENYVEILAIMMTLYPELEGEYQRALSRAQINALRDSRARD